MNYNRRDFDEENMNMNVYNCRYNNYHHKKHYYCPEYYPKPTPYPYFCPDRTLYPDFRGRRARYPDFVGEVATYPQFSVCRRGSNILYSKI